MYLIPSTDFPVLAPCRLKGCVTAPCLGIDIACRHVLHSYKYLQLSIKEVYIQLRKVNMLISTIHPFILAAAILPGFFGSCNAAKRKDSIGINVIPKDVPAGIPLVEFYVGKTGPYSRLWWETTGETEPSKAFHLWATSGYYDNFFKEIPEG